MKRKTITGSIRPRPTKDNVQYYTVVLEMGKDPNTGKRIRSCFRVDTDDKQEAEEFLLMKKAEYLQGELLMPSDMTVASYLDEYIAFCEGGDYSVATIRDYKNVAERYLKPLFGKKKLQELQKVHIQQTYNNLRKKSNASNKPLKATSIQHINRIFKAALNEAVERQYIKQNPACKIKIAKDTSARKLDVYTAEEIQKLQKAVKGTDMELPVALLFDCIMRRGELLGLRYSDINFNTKTITIRHSLVESEDCKIAVLKDCKTEDSCREMVVSDYTIKLLKKQKIKYRENKLKYGKEFDDREFVICQEDGKPFLPKSFTRKWARTLEIYGLRHIKLHGTRHSAISLLLSEGVPVHIVQQRAGHKDPKITLAVYSHVAKDKQNVVAEKLESLIFSAVDK